MDLVGHISACVRGVPIRSAVSECYFGLLWMVGQTCAILLLPKDSACFLTQPLCCGTHVDYAGTPCPEFFPPLYGNDKLLLP